MTTVDRTSKLDLDATWLALLQNEFRAARVTDELMCETTRRMQQEYGYTVDPHTAIAIAAAESLGYSLSSPQETPVAILSTASPCKFEESVTVALGQEGWNSYADKEFPERAKAVMSKTEIPPCIYKFREGSTLEQLQLEWEAMAVDIVEEMGKIDEST